MPRDVSEFRIVVASPSNLFEERQIILDVVQELNRVFEVQHVSLKGIGWEEYAAPGIGNEPQAVVSQQILRDYDMLIAVFWKTLGTPTEKLSSGTVEEIENAIANRSSVLGQHRVQVYFKDQLDSISGSSISELLKVEEYRDDLGKRGIFYRLFKSSAEFRDEVRVNIQRPILEFLQDGRNESQKSGSSPVVSSVAASCETNPAGPKDNCELASDTGFLDYMAEAEEAMDDAMASVGRMTALINEIGVESIEQAKGMEKLSAPGVSAREKKNLVNYFASFLVSKAGKLKSEASGARRDISRFSGAFVLAVAAQREQADAKSYSESIELLLKEAEQLLSAAIESRLAILQFKLSVENLPRITVQFNQAKRVLLDALVECVGLSDEMERSIYEITAMA